MDECEDGSAFKNGIGWDKGRLYQILSHFCQINRFLLLGFVNYFLLQIKKRIYKQRNLLSLPPLPPIARYFDTYTTKSGLIKVPPQVIEATLSTLPLLDQVDINSVKIDIA